MKSRRVDRGTPQTLKQPRLMRGSPPRYKAFVTLDECITAVQDLLAKHKLVVREGTVEMIAKTIQRCHTRMPREKIAKGETPRDRIKKAYKHAKKLLEYTKKPPRADSITKRLKSLRAALGDRDKKNDRDKQDDEQDDRDKKNDCDKQDDGQDDRDKKNDLSVTVRLALGQPRIDVPNLLKRLKRLRAGKNLDKATLTRLVRALRAQENGESTGRPTAECTRVVRDCCIAWRRAGKARRGYWWRDRERQKLAGPLRELVRDILSLCTSKQLGTLPKKKREPSSINEAQASINETRASITEAWRRVLDVSDICLEKALGRASSTNAGADCKNDGLVSSTLK